MAVLKKIEIYIFIIGLILCVTVRSAAAYQHVLTIRHLVWALIALGLLVSISIRNDFGAMRSGGMWLLAGYTIFVCLSGFEAINKSEWPYALLRAFTMLAFLLAAITVLGGSIYPAMTMLAAALSVYGLIKIAGGHTQGLDINPNQWAELLVLLVPFCWKHKSVVLLLLINIFFTKCRAAWLASIVIMFILSGKKSRYAIVGLLICAMLYFYFCVDRGLGSSARLGAWQATLAMAADHPLGVGAGNWKIVIPQYSRYFYESDIIFKTLTYTTPHNDYLWILSETGAGGLICYLGFLGCLLFKSLKNKNRMLMSGIAAWMVLSFFAFPIERAGHTALLLTFAGLILKDNFKPVKFGACLWPTAMIILIFTVWVFGARHRGNCQGQFVRTSKDITDMKISWFAQMDEGATPLYMFTGLRKYELEDYRAALDDFESAVKVNPNHSQALALMGLALINAGRFDEAGPYIKKSLAISPQLETAKIGAGFLTATGAK